VFYLREDIAVTEGDYINCQITVLPNSKNPREQDIKLEVLHEGKNNKTELSQQFYLR
jgi:hypothetical protein